MLDQLTKGTKKIAYEMVLIRSELSSLREANEAATKRKQRQKKRIPNQNVLTQADVEEIMAQNDVE